MGNAFSLVRADCGRVDGVPHAPRRRRPMDRRHCGPRDGVGRLDCHCYRTRIASSRETTARRGKRSLRPGSLNSTSRLTAKSERGETVAIGSPSGTTSMTLPMKTDRSWGGKTGSEFAQELMDVIAAKALDMDDDRAEVFIYARASEMADILAEYLPDPVSAARVRDLLVAGATNKRLHLRYPIQ